MLKKISLVSDYKFITMNFAHIMINKDFNKLICNRILTLRKEHNLKLEQLAYQSGISKGGLSEIERNMKEPRAYTILKICSGLGITMKEFFEICDYLDVTPMEFFDYHDIFAQEHNELMKELVEINNHNKKIEASGNMELKRVRSVALLGVDYISVGALTHSYKSLDISLKFYKNFPRSK